MIIISDMPRIHTFSHVEDKEKAAETQMSFIVRPGANFLNRDQVNLWNKFKALPDVLDYIAKGRIKVVADPKDAKAAKKKNDAPQSLVGYDHKMKVDIIQGTFDVELLKTWNDEETDRDAREALVTQIKVVEQIDKERAAAQLQN